MKVIVLHGDDTAKSYARLTKFIDSAKSRSWEIVYDELPATPSLFGTDRLIIYRDYKLLGKNDIKNFGKLDGTVVIYHSADLPAAFLKQMPADFKMEKFDLPKQLFVFLESVYPGNSGKALKLLHEIIKTEPVELVFFFLVRHLRDLYWVLVDPAPPGFPSWKVGKLMSQARKFDKQQIELLINDFTNVDIEVKTSKVDLIFALDLLILKRLE